MKHKTKLVCLCALVVGLQMDARKVQAVSNEDLEKEVQLLKSKVQELEKNTFPPEQSEEIKKVSEYVCPDGHTYSSPGKDFLCPIDGLKQTERTALIKVYLERREEVGEKISAMLEEEFKKRVNVAVSGTGIVQHITDSLNPETKKQTFAEGSVGLFFLSRPMRDTLFFMNLEAEGGRGPDSSVANFSILNNNTTHLPPTSQTDQVRLREAWLQKFSLSQRLRFVIGKIDLTNYFDRNRVANDETTEFVTGSLVNHPLLGNPPNGPGAALFFDSRRGIAGGIGIQSPDGSGVNVGEDPYLIGEMDLRFRLFASQVGNFRFWGARNGRTSGENRNDYSLGISADQELGSKAIIFARWGESFRREQARDPYAWSTGIRLQNLIPQRRRDKLGIAYSYLLTPTGPDRSGKPERIGEFYYSIFFSEHLSVSPLFQFVFDTAGSATASPQSNVLVLGLRTQIDF